jgi:hypothetical protein
MQPLRNALIATLIAAAVVLSAFALVVSQSTFPGTAGTVTHGAPPDTAGS